MVDVSKENLLPQEFEETETISPDNLPKGPLEITRAAIVEIKSGISQGQRKLVVVAKNSTGKAFTYWPNKSSISSIAETAGNETEDWLGKKIAFTTEKRVVRNVKRTVIYAKVV